MPKSIAPPLIADTCQASSLVGASNSNLTSARDHVDQLEIYATQQASPDYSDDIHRLDGAIVST